MNHRRDLEEPHNLGAPPPNDWSPETRRALDRSIASSSLNKILLFVFVGAFILTLALDYLGVL